MSLLSDAIAKVAKSSLKGIGKKQLWLTEKQAEHINMLIEAINEVRHTVEAETYDMDPSDQLVTPLMFLLVKIEI